MGRKKVFFSNWSLKMRKLHRYTGFFMMGIILIYAVSGIILIYRGTPLFKYSTPREVHLPPHLDRNMLREEVEKNATLHLRRFEVTGRQNGKITFAKNRYNSPGAYDPQTGQLKYTQHEYPVLVEKLVSLHKASSGQVQSPLNVLFGITLLLFIFSALFMFKIRSPIFKKGVIYMCSGLVLAIVLLIFM